MTGDMPFALREWLSSRRAVRHLAAVALAVTVFAYLGPFGTYDRFPPVERTIYWTVAMLVNWGLAVVFMPLLALTVERRGRPAWQGLTLGALLAAVPGTGVVWALEWGFGNDKGFGTGGLLYLYSCVALVFLTLGFLMYELVEKPHRRARASAVKPAEGAEPAGDPIAISGEDAQESPPTAAASVPFLDRLPAHLGRDLLHLHMQDHYVEVHTRAGSDLLLLRFRDALREVDGLEGMQVHRSHWVAREAVSRIERQNGRTLLHLVNGTVAPVSRSFAPQLKARGWI